MSAPSVKGQVIKQREFKKIQTEAEYLAEFPCQPPKNATMPNWGLYFAYFFNIL